jgi:hypothetical protein
MRLDQSLRSAVLMILRPLARIMLRHGMAFGEFAELAKKAFVDEAFLSLEAEEKRPTVSAVSALTGLTRKEAKRLQDADPESEAESSERYNRAIRVLSGWATGPGFLDKKGEPRPLPLDDSDSGFAALVKEFSGDIPVAAMLSVLESSGNIQVRDNEAVLLDRAYIPTDTPTEKINILGTDVAELIGTIEHNLNCPTEELRFQRKVSNTCLRADAVDAFRKLSNQKSQELLEAYDQWLSENETHQDGGSDTPCVYVAVGIYYVEDSDRRTDQ